MSNVSRGNLWYKDAVVYAIDVGTLRIALVGYEFRWAWGGGIRL